MRETLVPCYSQVPWRCRHRASPSLVSRTWKGSEFTTAMDAVLAVSPSSVECGQRAWGGLACRQAPHRPVARGSEDLLSDLKTRHYHRHYQVLRPRRLCTVCVGCENSSHLSAARRLARLCQQKGRCHLRHAVSPETFQLQQCSSHVNVENHRRVIWG